MTLRVYDYECQACNFTFETYGEPEEETTHCLKCNGLAKKVWTKFPNSDWFKPFVTEEFETHYGGPIKIESKRQLKDLCLKHNLTNRALGDVRNITEI